MWAVCGRIWISSITVAVCLYTRLFVSETEIIVGRRHLTSAKLREYVVFASAFSRGIQRLEREIGFARENACRYKRESVHYF